MGAPLAGGHRVDRFVEKPDRATAESFLASGDHVWNGGIFCMRAGRYREELGRTTDRDEAGREFFAIVTMKNDLIASVK